MVSKPSMASDINIKKPKQARKSLPAPRQKRERRRRLRSLASSSLARAIFISNMVGLLILMIGALTLNEMRRGLIDTNLQHLYSQAEFITNILASDATGDGAIPSLNEEDARATMARLALPPGTRVRLFDLNAKVIADSAISRDGVSIEPLDAAISPSDPARAGYPQGQSSGQAEALPSTIPERIGALITKAVRAIPTFKNRRERLRRNLDQDVRRALLGDSVVGEQYNADESLIVAVSLPVSRVQAVLGVVTLESNSVEAILASERRAFAPIAILGFLTALLSSLALTLFIALPIRRLARAAEIVRRSSESRDAIPDLSGRRDEIGDLSVVLRDMTGGLYDRIDDIANFAADVAHEIKNPLTSLRSATETLQTAKTEEQRGKLLAILLNDVTRMDRLITDISKASRMDAELAREEGEPVNLEMLLFNMADFYTQTRKDGAPNVRFIASDEASAAPLIIKGAGEKLGQVVRNLIDNAITFSPKGGEIRLRVREAIDDERRVAIMTVDDDGPGVPPDNLESIFDRFYTERPKGAAFGSHSGLGLAICRQIIRAHRGSITAQNRISPNGEQITGAKFTVTLPLDQRQ